MEPVKILQQIEAAATIQLYLLEHSAHDPKACMKDLKRLSRYIKKQCKQFKQSPTTIENDDPSNEKKAIPAESKSKGFDCLLDKLLSPSKATKRTESTTSAPTGGEQPYNVTFNLSLPPSPIRGPQRAEESFQDESCFEILSSINDWGDLKAYLNRSEEDSLDFEAAERAAVEAVRAISPPASPDSASRTPKALVGTPEGLRVRLRARPVSRGSLIPASPSVHTMSPALKADYEESPSRSGYAKAKKSSPRPLSNKLDLRQVSSQFATTDALHNA